MPVNDVTRVPTYRLHKARGCAVVTLGGRDIYLGTFGSAESKARYNRLVAQFLENGRRLPASDAGSYPIACLCDEFLSWAETEYRSSVENVRQALRTLFELFADVEASSFGPRSLVQYRDALVRKGLARSTVNDRVKLVRRAFKWATENERVPPSVLSGLQAVAGLRRGRGGAKETEPVRPAPEPHIEAALPHMSDSIRGAVELQLLTGARPGEILAMRVRDIARDGDVWTYQPTNHKNAWRGTERTIFLGPKAQAIVERLAAGRDEAEFLVSPTHAEQVRRARLRSRRRTPLTASHLQSQAAKQRGRRRQALRAAYDTNSYRQAITRACRRAGVPPWAPNRLRHNAATRLRAQFGLDVAKAVLGHARIETTQIYAEADRARAVSAMIEAG